MDSDRFLLLNFATILMLQRKRFIKSLTAAVFSGRAILQKSGLSPVRNTGGS